MTGSWHGVLAVAFVAVATICIGLVGVRVARTTSDFFVASRKVSPMWNASAIGGEYLSAASFLGIAGLVLAYGVDMLWYPVGYTAGYLLLLVLVAAPLRRSGAYTLPDFAESRLGSVAVRRCATAFVVLIGWLYLVPQLQGASLTLQTITGTPAWTGGLVVCVVVLLAALSGGMRSVTFVQAFQFWLKFCALLIPALFLIAVWRADGQPVGDDQPTVREATTVTVREATTVRTRNPETYVVDGEVDGRQVDGRLSLEPGTHVLAAGTRVTLPAGAEVPVRADLPNTSNDQWALPHTARDEHPVYATYSLILATFLGTMGLPHVLVRFYTNPDGRDTRRTTLFVICLLAGFYLLPPLYGVLGRQYAPDLLLTGTTDSAVLLLPERLIGGAGGTWLGALVAAGAFAAFLSTSSGLAISVAGALAQDVMRPRRRQVAAFRLGTLVAVLVPYLVSLVAQGIGVASVVGLAFAVAASSFCPLLVLGIWWRKLTAAGALAGLLTGGGVATAAVLATMFGGPYSGWLSALLQEPAAWSVPLAFAVMVGVSLLTRRRVPADVARTMVRLHLPETHRVARGETAP
ncbi:MAG: cation acetate symporter [Streptosporangiales bacterium]|nr:cation acetate symporter [Streptosporangiales bacterium]